MSIVRALANADELQGCRVKVQGYLRIDGPAALFITAEEAQRFNLSNSFALNTAKEPTDGGYVVSIGSGAKIRVPNSVIDSIVEGTIHLTNLGEPYIVDISLLILDDVPR